MMSETKNSRPFVIVVVNTTIQIQQQLALTSHKAKHCTALLHRAGHLRFCGSAVVVPKVASKTNPTIKIAHCNKM